MSADGVTFTPLWTAPADRRSRASSRAPARDLARRGRYLRLSAAAAVTASMPSPSSRPPPTARRAGRPCCAPQHGTPIDRSAATQGLGVRRARRRLRARLPAQAARLPQAAGRRAARRGRSRSPSSSPTSGRRRRRCACRCSPRPRSSPPRSRSEGAGRLGPVPDQPERDAGGQADQTPRMRSSSHHVRRASSMRGNEADAARMCRRRGVPTRRARHVDVTQDVRRDAHRQRASPGDIGEQSSATMIARQKPSPGSDDESGASLAAQRSRDRCADPRPSGEAPSNRSVVGLARRATAARHARFGSPVRAIDC